LTNSYKTLVAELDRILRCGESFDIIRRPLKLSAGDAVMYYIDGFVKDEISEKLIEFYLKSDINTLRVNIPYVEVEQTSDIDEMVTFILSGSTVLVVDGIEGAQIIDTRSYPTRGIEEPENDKVLRGSHDGFCETIVFNTALIRRRIRDPRLTMKLVRISECTRTDVVISYIDGRCDKLFLNKIIDKLSKINVKAINFGIESIAECLVPRHFWNPFPKFRFTERPDAAAAMLLEGSVIVICDNTPSVMLLPTSIFDFTQESDDMYLPPITGTYLRVLRFFVGIVTLLLTPTWLLLILNPSYIPQWLDFIKIAEPAALPVVIQLFIIEFAVDGLKLASLNTPSALSGSFSVVGGLILGDFAVKSGWFSPDVILYMAFVALGSFSQPSYELGYAIKFMRMIILALTAFFGVWGYAAGIVITIITAASVKTPEGSRGYLYPLIPFNARALARLFFRAKLK